MGFIVKSDITNLIEENEMNNEKEKYSGGDRLITTV